MWKIRKKYEKIAKILKLGFSFFNNFIFFLINKQWKKKY